MVFEGDFIQDAINIDTEKTAFDTEEAVPLAAELFAIATSVFVRGRATGEFAKACLRIDGGVLPMAVAADYIHIWLSSDERADLVSFGSEGGIGVIVIFAF